MALMLGSLHSALLAAGAPDDLARKAAEEVASYEARMVSIEARLSVLTWMVGSLIAMALAILWRVYR